VVPQTIQKNCDEKKLGRKGQIWESPNFSAHNQTNFLHIRPTQPTSGVSRSNFSMPTKQAGSGDVGLLASEPFSFPHAFGAGKTIRANVGKFVWRSSLMGKEGSAL